MTVRANVLVVKPARSEKGNPRIIVKCCMQFWLFGITVRHLGSKGGGRFFN
jgi:hypothetical protein